MKKKGKQVEVWKSKDVNWELFAEAIEDKFQSQNYDNMDINEKYNHWQEQVLSCAKISVGKIKLRMDGKKKSKSWWTKEIGVELRKRKSINRKWRKLRKRHEAGTLDLEDEMREQEQLYVRQKRKVSAMIREAMAKSENKIVDEWNKMSMPDRQKEQWRYMNIQLRGGKDVDNVILKKNNVDVDDEDSVKEVMEDFWRGIFCDDRLNDERYEWVNELRVSAENEEDLFSEDDLKLNT